MSDTLDIWLGSQAGGGSSAEAEMANLFIYDQPMSAGQADSLHRALLWTDILPGDEEYNATSTITITYDYDPLYRLTSASYSAGAEYEYTYDAVGNRQTMDSPGGQASYTYDAANRLTGVGGVAHTWDDNGNLTSDGVRSYSYDHANRLTQVTQGSLTTQFAYNGDGVRTSKTVGGDTTQYVQDLLATLPVVISDTDAVYLYGLDIIAQQQAERLYYMHDGLGSVRQSVGTTGQVESNYAYDPFGVPVVAGGVSNPYQYTGEAWDAEVELLYLRARYYQPEAGRFITKDRWPGNVWRPATLNRHVYVANDPVNSADPSGLDGGGPGGVCPECREVAHGYVRLEDRLWNTPGPFIMGGHWWLQAAVERDPLVRQVYVQLRTRLEQAYREGTGPIDPMGDFVCLSIEETLRHMAEYAPLCESKGDDECARIAVRVALNALAATVQRLGERILPEIGFETPQRIRELEDVRVSALPWMERPLSALPEWDTSGGTYASQERIGPSFDKSYHFFTHAFMAYELRWGGYAPYEAWRMNDWQGRMLEQFHGPYSTNDVIVNRWGSAFGLAAFEHPRALIDRCTGASCRTGIFR